MTQPRVNWSMSQYRKAQGVASSGEGNPDKLANLSAMVSDFEKDLAEGFEPPAGKQEGVPATRSAQEVGVEGTYDPAVMRGQLAQPLMEGAPVPDMELGEGDTLAAAEADVQEPEVYDTNYQSASQHKALYADPVYEPEPGEIDPLTGLAAPGAGFAEPEKPYFHQEPSVDQFVDYLKRAKESTDRPEMQELWDEALESAVASGEESPHYAEFADRQWQEVRRAFAERGAPVSRVAYQDIMKGNLGDRLEGELARIAEPFIAGADQMATFGVGGEALAAHGNRRYSESQQQALDELEQSGTLMPMSARIKDVMETSPWSTGFGYLAGAFTPGGAGNILMNLGAKAMAAGGKTLAKMTPSLLRGTSMGAAAGRGVVKHGTAGAAAAIVEEQTRGLTQEAGRKLRGERKYEIGMGPMGIGEAALTGGIGGVGGGLLATGVEKLAKNLRLQSEKPTRAALAKVEDLLEGPRGTSVLSGIKQTPEMKAVLERELKAGTSAGRKTGVELELEQMAPAVARLGREGQEDAIKAAGTEKVAFHARNETNMQSMQASSDRMLQVARSREGIPFSDDTTFFQAFKDVTDVTPVASKGEAQQMVNAAGGGQVMSVTEARKLFGSDYVKRKLAKLKESDPDIADAVDDAPLEDVPLELDLTGRPMEGMLLEPSEVVDTSPVYLAVTGKMMNPRQYDLAVEGLNRKIRYGEGTDYKDPEWLQLGRAIREDRDKFGPEWGATKKRHEDVANLWETRRKKLGVGKKDWNERDQMQLESIHKALRSAGKLDDATDAQVWRLLEEKPGLLKKLKMLKATEARRELLSGDTTPTKWSILRELYRGARLRSDALLGMGVGDPLRAVGPARLGMLTPQTETLSNMGTEGKKLLEKLFRLTPASEEEEE